MFIQKRVRRVVTACVMTMLALSTVSAESIRVATTEYAPFTSEDSQFSGFVNRVIEEAFKREGVSVEFVYLPWKRAVEQAANGDYGALSFSFENEQRAKRFYFSDALSDHKELFFHLKSLEVPDWQTLEDLAEFSFGATRGYTYTEEFWEAARNETINVSVATSDEQNIRKLSAGRIDLFPMDEITGWNLINTNYPDLEDELTTHSKPLRSTNGFLCVSKQIENGMELITRFNAGLAEMKSDGTYDRYFDDLREGKY